MGKDIFDAYEAAREVFQTAGAVTGLPIQRLCFEGPEEELNRTDAAQPAIFTVSAAMLAAMKQVLSAEQMDAIKPAFMAGLSLGEYTALYASGAISLSDALKLVTRRGAAMQSAAVSVPSSMVCIMGLDEAKVAELCQAAAQGQVLTPANFNSPGQIVISGETAACARAEAMAKDFGASGAIALKVAGAFHSQIMAPAAKDLSGALADVKFQEPTTPVVANVDAQPYACMCQASDKLLSQLTGAVRWQQSIEWLLAQGVERFYEIGPGKVLAGLMRRISRRTEVISVNSAEAIEKLRA